tara:strand:+ start:966 stop:1301 length:336 start_codon:yes stop_codon:yes gene_type:complete
MKYIITLLPLLISLNLYSQKLYIVDHAFRADVKLYEVNYANQADVLVYVAPYPHRSKGNKGHWYFSEFKFMSDKTVFFTNYRFQADVKVFFVRYPSQAKWKNIEKKKYFEK